MQNRIKSITATTLLFVMLVGVVCACFAHNKSDDEIRHDHHVMHHGTHVDGDPGGECDLIECDHCFLSAESALSKLDWLNNTSSATKFDKAILSETRNEHLLAGIRPRDPPQHLSWSPISSPVTRADRLIE